MFIARAIYAGVMRPFGSESDGCSAMRFRGYLAGTMRGAFSSSLALGVVLGVLVLATGGAEGEVSLDIDLSRGDSFWFFLGVPVLISALFLFVSPLSYFIYRVVFRGKSMKSSNDV